MTSKFLEDGTERQRRAHEHERSRDTRPALDRDRTERNRGSKTPPYDFSSDGYDEMLRMLAEGRVTEREAKRYFGCQYENAARATGAFQRRE